MEPAEATPKKRGRKRIAPELLASKEERSSKLDKRKDTVIKAAHQLHVLTGCEVFLLVQAYDSDNANWRCHFYASDAWKKSMKEANSPLSELLYYCPRLGGKSQAVLKRNATAAKQEGYPPIPGSYASTVPRSWDFDYEGKQYAEPFVIHRLSEVEVATEDEDDDDEEVVVAKKTKKKKTKTKKQELLPQSDADSTVEEGDEEKKKTLGRLKIEIKYLEDKTKRRSAFYKRRRYLVKACFMLRAITGCEVFLAVYNREEHRLNEQILFYSSPGIRSVACTSRVLERLRSLATGYQPTEAAADQCVAF